MKTIQILIISALIGVIISILIQVPFASSDSGSLIGFDARSPDISNMSLVLYDKFNQVSPNSTKDLYLEFFDEKNKTLVKNVSFFVNATKDDTVLIHELFYTHTGIMTLKFSPSGGTGKYVINGTAEPVLGGMMSNNDILPIEMSAFTPGIYHFHIEVLALVYTNGIDDQTNPPTFDSWWSVDDKGNISKDTNSTTISKIKNASPLQQFKSGVAADNVKCGQGFQLVIKSEDGSPACVKPQTTQKLVERGWALDQLQQKSENVATNSSSALKLSLFTNSTIIQSGHAIGITLSLDNTRSSLLNLNSQNNWLIQGLDSGGCSWLPMGIAILDGYYTAQNMSNGHPMLLHFLYPCPPSLPVKTFTFQPMSSNITVTCEPGGWASCQHLTQTKTSVAYSSFLQDGKFFDFNPGNYTLVAGDEWGDSAIQHFQVVNSTRTHIEYDPPIVTQTYDIHGTVKDIMPNTTFAKLASSSTGIQMAHGGGLDTYDNDSIKLELNYGNTSGSHVISATVQNLSKKTVHIYDIFISGFIPLANDDHLNLVVVRGDPYVVPKNDAILEPGESVTKYIVGNWTVNGKPVTGFSAGTSYSYDDLQNFDGMTNGYSMSVPVQWVK